MREFPRHNWLEHKILQRKAYTPPATGTADTPPPPPHPPPPPPTAGEESAVEGRGRRSPSGTGRPRSADTLGRTGHGDPGQATPSPLPADLNGVPAPPTAPTMLVTANPAAFPLVTPPAPRPAYPSFSTSAHPAPGSIHPPSTARRVAPQGGRVGPEQHGFPELSADYGLSVSARRDVIDSAWPPVLVGDGSGAVDLSVRVQPLHSRPGDQHGPSDNSGSIRIISSTGSSSGSVVAGRFSLASPPPVSYTHLTLPTTRSV